MTIKEINNDLAIYKKNQKLYNELNTFIIYTYTLKGKY